jgi:hypothetical protein
LHTGADVGVRRPVGHVAADRVLFDVALCADTGQQEWANRLTGQEQQAIDTDHGVAIAEAAVTVGLGSDRANLDVEPAVQRLTKFQPAAPVVVGNEEIMVGLQAHDRRGDIPRWVDNLCSLILCKYRTGSAQDGDGQSDLLNIVHR